MMMDGHDGLRYLKWGNGGHKNGKVCMGNG